MDSTQNPCQRELEIEVPAGAVARETEAIIARLQKSVRLPGFRKGKVPATVIRQRFGEDLKSEVVEALVPRYFREEVSRQGLKPVSQPQVTDLHWHEGGPLHFKASFEVLPEIEVTDYREAQPERPDVSIQEDEVERTLSELRERHASFDPVEGRGLEEGDFAAVSFAGTPREEGGKPVNVDEVMVEIGGQNTMAEFNQNLLGAQAGDQRSFDVTYPEDFGDQRLAGKSIAYQVTVKGIKRKSLPELDDAFAKELGAFETLEDLRQAVREQLEAQKKHAAEHEAKDKLVDELVRRHPFPVPESLVERQIDARLERGLRALASQGMRTDDMKKLDFTRLRAGQREAAEKEVRASLILDRIAERENIEASDEEVEREIASLAAQMQQTPEAIRARLTREGALDRIRDRIRSEKTLDFLYSRPA